MAVNLGRYLFGAPGPHLRFRLRSAQRVYPGGAGDLLEHGALPSACSPLLPIVTRSCGRTITTSPPNRACYLPAVTCGSAGRHFCGTVSPTEVVTVGPRPRPYVHGIRGGSRVAESRRGSSMLRKVDRAYEATADGRGRDDGRRDRLDGDTGRELGEHREPRHSPLSAHRPDHDGTHQLRE